MHRTSSNSTPAGYEDDVNASILNFSMLREWLLETDIFGTGPAAKYASDALYLLSQSQPLATLAQTPHAAVFVQPVVVPFLTLPDPHRKQATLHLPRGDCGPARAQHHGGRRRHAALALARDQDVDRL